MMTMGQIYRELSKVGTWAAEPQKVRVIAARYYADVDDLDTLRRYADRRTVSEEGDLRPQLTGEQVAMIRDLR